MSEEIPADDAPAEEPAAVAIPWAQATMSDLDGFDVDSVIADSRSADVRDLHFKFGPALQAMQKDGKGDTPHARVLNVLHAITGLRFKPEEPHDPFQIDFMIEGKRSAALSDFSQEQVDVIAALSKKTQHPSLRARLADVTWLLNRKRVEFAIVAVESYVETIRQAMADKLEFFAKERGALDRAAVNYLKRALHIGRTIGWDSATTKAARDVAVELRVLAGKETNPVPLHWFSELDLTFRLSEPSDVAAEIEGALSRPDIGGDTHIASDLWRLAGDAYHAAKREDDKHRCHIKAAERFAADAEKIFAAHGSAMLAAHLMSTALSRLHGIPGQKERRKEIRHRLIDIQANIVEDMQSHSVPFDPEPFAIATEKAFAALNLRDKLYRFAMLDVSPDPEKLAADAREAIKKHPLSSLFGSSHIDQEGKTIHKSDGASFADAANSDAVMRQVAQTESIRRNMLVAAHIDPARHAIVSAHYLSDDIFLQIFQYSGFVPPDLLGTFARGFLRFFQGDFASALYLLTPLLENSLRYVLRQNGHDVTIFDDATQVQEDRTISALYEQMRPQMEAIFSKAIVEDLERVFLTKAGPHLRHSVAHGLMTDGMAFGPDAVYACWIIYRLAMLSLIVHRNEISLDFGWLE